MDLKSLEEALIEGRFRGWYLNGGLLDDTLTIGKIAHGWEVYHSERGKKYYLKTFTNEDKACQYFLDTIRGTDLTNM